MDDKDGNGGMADDEFDGQTRLGSVMSESAESNHPLPLLPMLGHFGPNHQHSLDTATWPPGPCDFCYCKTDT